VSPGWAAFLGLTGFVLSAMLVLARLSPRALEGSADRPAEGGQRTAAGPSPRAPATSRVEPREAADVGPTVGEFGSGSESDSTSSVEHGGTPSSPAAQTGPDLRDRPPAALLANVALTQGLFAGLILGGAWFFEIPAAAFGVEPRSGSVGIPAVALGVGFGVGLWIANEAGSRLADAMGVGSDESLRKLLAPDSAGGWVLLLGVVLPSIAVAEEIIFRGAVVGVPANGFGASPWALAVLSSVAFALGHGAQGRVGVIVTGVLGFVLAAGFVLTGSLLAVIVAHYLVNALEFVVHEGLDDGAGMPDGG
jgi:membrane protease YdiL (CAAX protease family)